VGGASVTPWDEGRAREGIAAIVAADTAITKPRTSETTASCNVGATRSEMSVVTGNWL